MGCPVHREIHRFDGWHFLATGLSRRIDGPDGRPYAVDIFRGGGGSIHDWALHGEGPAFAVKGVELKAVDQFPGKDYAYEEVSNVQSGPINGEVQAQWKWNDGAILEAHIASQEDAQFFTTLSPGMRLREQQDRKIHSLFIRRSGENLRSQFIAAYDPHRGDSQVKGIETMTVSPQADWALVFKVQLAGGITDYIFSAYIDVTPLGEVFQGDGLAVPWKSRFGVVRVKDGQIMQQEWIDAPMEGLAHDI